MTRRLWVIERETGTGRWMIMSARTDYRAARTELREWREHNLDEYVSFRLSPYVPAGPKARKRVRQ